MTLTLSPRIVYTTNKSLPLSVAPRAGEVATVSVHRSSRAPLRDGRRERSYGTVIAGRSVRGSTTLIG